MHQIDIDINSVGENEVQWTVSFAYEDSDRMITCGTCTMVGTKDQFQDFCTSFKYVIGHIGPSSESALFSSLFQEGEWSAAGTEDEESDEFDA